MDISKNEMLNILNNLNEMFDKNNCEHLQLLLYLIYLNDYKDKDINQAIDQLILKTKTINDCAVFKEECNKPKDVTHPYPQPDNLGNYYISFKFQNFLNF